jgi:DNA-binding beta-propeller fold protein YncE
MPAPFRASALAAALALLVANAQATGPLDSASIAWTQKHTSAPTGFLSEIVSFDSLTKSLWVAGVHGVQVLDAATGTALGFIAAGTGWAVNSVAMHGGIAAFALENTTDRKLSGVVRLYDTATRSLASGTNEIAVGALPDMVTFTADGSKLLVANEGTPASVPDTAYTLPDPVGSVSIISMASRSVVATPTFGSVTPVASNMGSNVRQPGMDFEPEYIAINKAGTKAFVSLQENNALGIIDLATNSTTKVVGLGSKDFNLTGNEIDPRSNSSVVFANHAVRGLYMPDGLATYQAGGKGYVVLANEGDLREDDGDRTTASTYGASGDLAGLRVVNDLSSAGNLFAPGARSFSIRDEDGNLVYDSGSILDREAAALGIYDDGRSRDKGVEPEGVELLTIGGRTYAFIGLERTTTGAIAVFDITAPESASFVRMLLTGATERRPEGLKGFTMDGMHYLAVTSEGSSFATSGTTLFALAPVPEPGTYALMLAGLAGVLALSRRRAAR